MIRRRWSLERQLMVASPSGLIWLNKISPNQLDDQLIRKSSWIIFNVTGFKIKYKNPFYSKRITANKGQQFLVDYFSINTQKKHTVNSVFKTPTILGWGD